MGIKYEGALWVCSGEFARKSQNVVVIRRRWFWGMVGDKIESKGVDYHYDGSFVCRK